MNRHAENENGDRVCPFMGLVDDPETAHYFPSPENHCHRARPATSVNLKYQRSCCLSRIYYECNVFQKDLGLPLPSELRGEHPQNARQEESKIRYWMILPAFALIGFILWQSLSSGLQRFSSQEQPTGVTAPVSVTETDDSTPVVTLTRVQSTSTSTALQTFPSLTWTITDSTPIVIPSHALETPIGIKYKFVIHRVIEGESLITISNYYGTTAEAIQLVNFTLLTHLKVNDLIIIPFNLTDVSGLPVFESLMVKKDIPVEQLAQQLMVDPFVFKYYNGLQDRQIVAAGAWVLLPHMGTASPQP